MGAKDILRKEYQIAITTVVFCLMIVLPIASGVVEESPGNVNQERWLNKDYPQNSNYSSIRKHGEDATLSKEISPLSVSYNSVFSQHDSSFSAINTIMEEHQWPQQGFNCQHIGRSPYSTAANPGIEKWRSPTSNWCFASPVIDANGIIYFGSVYLYAVYPDGSLKWTFYDKYNFGDYGSHPAIAEDGTIYIATTFSGLLYAVSPNGTELWNYSSSKIDTSITVANNGILYYGHQGGLNALNPNGTLKWTFHTSNDVQSTPAVDDNGIIYFGSHDFNIYAVYPNGTQKWNYTTAAWVHGSPTIGTDGTIYCGSDDGYLYAFYPNGTLKWKTYTSSGMRSSPSQDKNGNLYFGMWDSKIMSVAPDGTIRWTFPLRDGDRVWGSSVAISDDGTIYIGNSIDMDMNGGGEIIALTLNGTLKWRKTICDLCLYSSPVIANDGTVYICGSNGGYVGAMGYLYAFNTIENDQPPNAPTIDGPKQAKVGTNVIYTLQANDPDKTPVHYLVDWGDGSAQEQTHDMEPGVPIKVYHSWSKRGTYVIKAKAIDTFGLESNWTTFSVKMPIIFEPPQHPFLNWLFQRFPYAFPILRHLLGQ